MGDGAIFQLSALLASETRSHRRDESSAGAAASDNVRFMRSTMSDLGTDELPLIFPKVNLEDDAHARGDSRPSAAVRCDLTVIGSGFAGTILAMAARRVGLSVVLIDRSRPPRNAIGESSTPLANLHLEELADEFNLPMLRHLSKWG